MSAAPKPIEQVCREVEELAKHTGSDAWQYTYPRVARVDTTAPLVEVRWRYELGEVIYTPCDVQGNPVDHPTRPKRPGIFRR